MMKFVLATAFCFVLSSAMAQGIDEKDYLYLTEIQSTKKCSVKWGSSRDLTAKETHTQYIGAHNKKHFTLSKGEKGFFVHEKSEDFSQLKSNRLKLSYSGKRLDFEGIVLLEDNFVIMSSFKNSKLKKNFLFYSIVPVDDIHNYKPDGENLVNVGEIEYAKQYRAGSLKYVQSHDKSKILLYFNQSIIKTPKYKLIVFDKNMVEQWSLKTHTPFDATNFMLSNNGDVHVLSHHPLASVSAKIVSYTEKGTRNKTYQFELNGSMSGIQAHISKDDKTIICAGMTDLGSDFAEPQTVYVKIDLLKQTIASNLSDALPENIVKEWSLTETVDSRIVEKDYLDELTDYEIRDFVFKDDGSVVMFIEEYFVNTTGVPWDDENGVTRTERSDFYHFDDIVVVSVDPNGKIEWCKRIQKQQVSAEDQGYFWSFLPILVNDKIHIVFNQRIRPFYDEDLRKELSFDARRAQLALMITLDAEGNIEKESLFDVRAERTAAVPRVSAQISDNRAIIYSRFKKTEKFAEIDFGN